MYLIVPPVQVESALALVFMDSEAIHQSIQNMALQDASGLAISLNPT